MAKQQGNKGSRTYSDTNKKDSGDGKFRSEIPPKKPKPSTNTDKKQQ